MKLKSLLFVVAVVSVTLAVTANADFIPYGAQGSGTLIGDQNPTSYTFTAANTGPVTAYFAGSTAGDYESLGLMVNGTVVTPHSGPMSYGSWGVFPNQDTATGASVNLANVTAGDSLVFLIYDFTQGTTVYSKPSLNTGGYTGQNHVYSAPYTATSNITYDTANLQYDPSNTHLTFPLDEGFAIFTNEGIPAGTFVSFEDLPAAATDYNYNDEDFVFLNTSSTPIPEPGIGLSLLMLGGLFLRRRRAA